MKRWEQSLSERSHMPRRTFAKVWQSVLTDSEGDLNVKLRLTQAEWTGRYSIHQRSSKSQKFDIVLGRNNYS